MSTLATFLDYFRAWDTYFSDLQSGLATRIFRPEQCVACPGFHGTSHRERAHPVFHSDLESHLQ